VSAVDAIANVQARIGSIEQRLGIARPAASASASATTATDSTGLAAGATTTVGHIDLSGSFEDIAASIEAALQDPTTFGTTPTGIGSIASTGFSATAATTVRGVVSAPTGALAASTPYADLFQQAGAKYGIDPKVLAGVAYVESRFQTDVVSSAGAVGMMQFMPSTAASLGVDSRDPASAIDGAARYLRSQIDRFGSVDMALAAYNTGPGAVADAGGIQPGSQAEKYVSAVRAAMGRV
jgi:membrane-bound lytic murein transglycosylase B